MGSEKTQIFPPIKLGDGTFSIGRALRFLIGVGIIVHTAFFWSGVWQEALVRYVAGVALIDVTLIVQLATAWKSTK